MPGEDRQFNNPVKFSINGNGQISLIEPLDREEIEVYTLNVKAETQSTPPLVAYVEISVQVRWEFPLILSGNVDVGLSMYTMHWIYTPE